jgi:putative transposase
MTNITKNIKIKTSLLKTREKRGIQKCKVFELKLDSSHFNQNTSTSLKMMFVEAKWLYNFILSQKDPFKYDYKTNPIQVMNKDKELVEKELKYLSAKERQDVVYRLRQNICNLSKVKKKGNKVGKLKFQSNCSSINLSQYGYGGTHNIVSSNRIKVQGIKQHLRVYGLGQIKPEYEIANAKLLKKASGYYLKLTCFEFIKPEHFIKEKKEDVGIDFGIKDSIITSDGEKFKISVEESEHLKRLHRRFSKTIKGSNNRYRLRLLLQKEYENITNRRNDVGNKIVNYLLTNYSTVYFQDEMIKQWQKGLFGKQIQNSCLGRIKMKLKNSSNAIMIPQSFPSTKLCLNCGKMNILSLSDRIYKCECGYSEDRDIKAAKTLLHVGKCKTNYIPMERRLKPVEKILDLSKTSVLDKQSSLNQEAEVIQ